jgi:hypothetical protein
MSIWTAYIEWRFLEQKTRQTVVKVSVVWNLKVAARHNRITFIFKKIILKFGHRLSASKSNVCQLRTHEVP